MGSGGTEQAQMGERQDPFEFGRAYFEPRIAERYGQQHLKSGRRLSHARESRIIARLLGPAAEPGRSIALDAPSGSGRFAAVLHELGFRVIGLDRAATMTRQAAESGCDAVINGSIRELPFVDGAIDAMICVRFLHHLPGRTERVACLREIRRITSGPIVVTAWITNPLVWMRRTRKPRDGTRFLITRRELRATLKEAGLQAVRHISHVPIWSPIVYFRLEPIRDPD
jgi:SAM-dependent methyltransferase